MATSNLPLSRNFTIFVGATFSQTFHWTTGGLDVDLTGWDAWMPYGLGINTPFGELSVAEGTITLDANGVIQIYLSDEQTVDMFGDQQKFPKVQGVYTLAYQLSLQNDSGEIIRFMRGDIYLQYDLHRPPVNATPTTDDFAIIEDMTTEVLTP